MREAHCSSSLHLPLQGCGASPNFRPRQCVAAVHRNSMFSIAICLAGLLVCAPAGAHAQAAQRAQQDFGVERIGAESAAARLLARRSELRLTVEQVAQLEQMQANWVRTRSETRERVAAATARLRGGAPSPSGHKELEQVMMELRESEGSIASTALAVLSEVQRQALSRP